VDEDIHLSYHKAQDKGIIAECTFVCEKYILIIEKQEEDSRFRSTNTAQCAEKGESSSCFSYALNDVLNKKWYSGRRSTEK